ncbi:UNVERIFIED_CONTAM: hypothetical protein HDU68_007327 [Siphonaria sp. JEL0065]|nr:hypothetical protein HDU68_007327 [Siphonaria sp. JEL0065]
MATGVDWLRLALGVARTNGATFKPLQEPLEESLEEELEEPPEHPLDKLDKLDDEPGPHGPRSDGPSKQPAKSMLAAVPVNVDAAGGAAAATDRSLEPLEANDDDVLTCEDAWCRVLFDCSMGNKDNGNIGNTTAYVAHST